MGLLHTRDTEAADLTFEKVDQDPEAFVELVDTLARRRQRDADRVVLGLRVSRTEPELEAAIGEQVDGCGLASEKPRVVKRAVDHERADAQRGRHVGRADEGQEWIGDAEVVGGLQGAVAEPLRAPRDLLVLGSRSVRKRLEREPERLQSNRSPASTETSSRLPNGANGQLQRGSNAHDGAYEKLKSTISAPPRSAPLTVSSTYRPAP